jgi:uncharacterized protein YbjT (DUF2867 family)
MKIVIAAASGNIGRRTAEKVIQAGAETVLLARNSEKLADLVDRGAIVEKIGSDDSQGLIAVTQYADALFWLTPPKLDVLSLADWYTQIAMAGAKAVRENRIKRVVNISSMGAGAAANLGTVSFMGEVESLFNQTGANVVHLRPGYFMENFLAQVESIRNSTFSFTFTENHDIPWISTDDIGDAAARYLLDDRWAGQWTRNLMGTENLTLTQIAQILSRVLGKSIEYRKSTVESSQEELASFGATPGVQRELGDLFRALGDLHGVYATVRTPDAITPTTFEQFVHQKLLPAIGSIPVRV